MASMAVLGTGWLVVAGLGARSWGPIRKREGSTRSGPPHQCESFVIGSESIAPFVPF